MATITGLTAERMLEIEAASVVDGEILAGHLILTKHDGTQIDSGSVVGPTGPTGPTGATGATGPESGQELAYVETTGPLPITATTAVTAQTFLTAPGLTLDGVTKILIETYIPYIQISGGVSNLIMVNFFDGSTDLGNHGLFQPPSGATVSYMPGLIMRRLTPTAGVHVFSVRSWGGAAGGVLGANVGGAGNYAPAFLRITRAV